MNKSIVYILEGNIEEDLHYYYTGYFQKGNPCVTFDIEYAAMFSSKEIALSVAKYAEGFEVTEHLLHPQI